MYRRIPTLWSKFQRLIPIGSVEFESPDRKGDVQTTIRCYLQNSFTHLGDCYNITEPDILLIYKTISEVTKYYENARVIDVTSANTEGILFYQDFSYEVYYCQFL